MKNLMEKVLNDVKKNHAEADLILNRSTSLKMSTQEASLSEYKVSSSQVLGLRLIKDGKVGLAYTESLDEDALKLMIKQALGNADTNHPNPNEKILNHSGEIRDEMTYEEQETPISLKVEKAISLETELKKREPRFLASTYNGYSEGEYTGIFMSTSGRSTFYSDKIYSIYTAALLGENGKKANYYDFDISHTYKDLLWEKVIAHSLDYSRQILKEQTLETGKYQIRFTEDALKNLMHVFSSLFSAKAAMDKVNPWAQKLGEVVMAKCLSIDDHADYKKAFRISKFDSEGVERKHLSLIEDGVLKSFYHNSLTSHFFKTQNTGHASRGPQGPLGLSETTMLIQGKDVKPLPPKYLEIFQLDGLHAGTNRITGDFSLPVKGFVWENAEKKMTFGNVTLGGNFFNMLKEVEVVGSELHASSDASFFSVPLIFNDLSIAGK